MNELRLPELGENVETVDVAAVLVKQGERIRRDQPVIEVETEKASLEVPATHEGTIVELKVKPGDRVTVGQVILVIDSGPVEASADPPSPAPAAKAPQAPAAAAVPEPEEPVAPSVVAFPRKPSVDRPLIGKTVAAAPSTRALARELGVDIAEVPGTGSSGRVTRSDVKAHAKRLIRGGGATGPAAGQAPLLPDFSQWGEVERQPLSKVRRVTAAHMANAWATVPHVTQFDHADITALESMRKTFNTRPEAEGVKLTVTAIALKMVAAGLKQFPVFNASLDAAGDAVVYKRYVHIGVAVDTERGLLVPVIRDVDAKSLLEVAGELSDLASRARERKIKPDEMQGASFTVSNLGGLGTTYFSPIVNWPQVAILGIGRAEMQPVHVDGGFEPRRILPLSVSYDHRLIDGADAARFLRWTAEALEQPLLLLLDAPGS